LNVEKERPIYQRRHLQLLRGPTIDRSIDQSINQSIKLFYSAPKSWPESWPT